MRICTKVLKIRDGGGYFALETDAAEIRIFFLTDEIIRIRVGFDGDFAERSYTLVMTAWDDAMDEFMRHERTRVAPAEARLTDSDTAAVIQGRKLRVVVEKEPLRICVYDEDGTLLHADIAGRAYLEDSNLRRIHTCEISEEDGFYGFGEKAGPLNKAKEFLTMNPGDALGYDPCKSDSLYKHIPFYIRLSRTTHKAVGYFYHNMYQCDFDLGREHSNYWKRHSRYRTDGGDIDLFLIAGPSVRSVVERYTDLTGKSVMLPEYALGYLGSSMYYPELPQDSDDAIIGFTDIAHEEGIPLDGFMLSSGYCTVRTDKGLKRCVFTWNRKRFKNPEDFFRTMRERGVQVSPNVKPGFLLAHPMREMLERQNFFIRNADGTGPAVGDWWGGRGEFADFTNPETRRLWKELLKEHVLQYGTPCVWNDNCEYDSIVDRDSFCDYDGAGGTLAGLKPVMSNLMCRVADEAVREQFPDERPFVMCRSGFSGIQRYAQTWAGDNYTSWDSLRWNIATMLGMGLSGVANQGCDIGGFAGPAPGEELFVRWVQNGVFQPRFSIHSANYDNSVTEPWMYSGTKNLVREAIRFRYRLMPYLYSLMQRAHETGLPIMEPMCSAFQNDPTCYDECIDFMLGDSLLVANVVEPGARTRRVYLPEGADFYDFRTRRRYEGGQTVEFPVGLDTFPLLLKSGAVLPMADHDRMNLQHEPLTGLRVLIVPDRAGAFCLYEDDGVTCAYERGVYRKTLISVEPGEVVSIHLEHEGSYSSTLQRMEFDVVCKDKAPLSVRLSDRPLKHFLSRKAFEQAVEGWYYSQTLHSVQVRFPAASDDACIEVSFRDADFLSM